MTSVRELLVREVERLSEEDAREVLDLLKRKQAKGLSKNKVTDWRHVLRGRI